MTSETGDFTTPRTPPMPSSEQTPPTVRGEVTAQDISYLQYVIEAFPSNLRRELPSLKRILASLTSPAGEPTRPDREAVVEALNEMENAVVEWAQNSEALSARTLNARAALLALIFPPAAPQTAQGVDK